MRRMNSSAIQSLWPFRAARRAGALLVIALLAALPMTGFAQASGSTMMKAARAHAYGGPEVLKIEEAPRPEPAEDEVLIELRASGVNRADVLTRGGGYHAAGQPPIVRGFEGSGVVREN